MLAFRLLGQVLCYVTLFLYALNIAWRVLAFLAFEAEYNA